MVQKSLTDIAIRKFNVVENKRIELWDTKLPGFGVRISPKGTKSFILLYWFEGRKRRMTLGRYPTLSLAQARLMAKKALNDVAHGRDPQPEKKAHQKEYRFQEVVGEFLSKHCQENNRPSSREQTERILKKRFVSSWGNRDIRHIKRADILLVLDSIMAEKLPSASNHALSAIRKFFNWCIERDLIEQSPCFGVKKPAKESSRDRILEDEELKKIWIAAEEYGYPFGTIVQLLMLMGQRRNEVSTMRWPDINFEENYWSIPAEYSKSNRPHIVPLSKLSQKLILNIPSMRKGFVFPARGNENSSFSGFANAKKKLAEAAGVDDWRLHDLRRTLATDLGRLQVDPHIVERILNHTSGTFAGVAGVYNRFGYFEEKRSALESWSRFIEKLISKE